MSLPLSSCSRPSSPSALDASQSILNRLRAIGINRIVHYTKIDRLENIIKTGQIASAEHLKKAEQILVPSLVDSYDRTAVYALLSPEWLIDPLLPPTGLGLERNKLVAVSLPIKMIFSSSYENSWDITSSWAQHESSGKTFWKSLEDLIEKRFYPQLKPLTQEGWPELFQMSAKDKSEIMFRLNHQILFKKSIDLKQLTNFDLFFASEEQKDQFLLKTDRTRISVQDICKEEEVFKRIVRLNYIQ